MHCRLISLILICMFTAVGYAQPPDTLWARTYGWYTSEICYSVDQTTDGGFILGGIREHSDAIDNDFYLIRVNTLGDTLWCRDYSGNAGGLEDECYSVQQTADGGFIMGGYTESYLNQINFFAVKTDSDGDTLWCRSFWRNDSSICYSIRQAADGGFILGGIIINTGDEQSDILMVKMDSAGDTLWSRVYGGNGDSYCRSVRQTTDGGYVLGGYTDIFGAGSDDFYLLKTDAAGDTLWTRAYGGTQSDRCYSVQQTADGGYILGGYTQSFGVGEEDILLVKTDAAGDTLWVRTYGGRNNDRCNSVQQTTDGGYILVGETYSYGQGLSDYYIVKTNASGDTLWTLNYGGYSYDQARSVKQTADGGYIIGGYTNSFGSGSNDFFIITLDRSIPIISSISDVGNDQGRQARLHWIRSPYDVIGSINPILQYSIYRRINLYRQTDPGRPYNDNLDWPPGEWEFIANVPAYTEEDYTVIVPTLADSTSEGIYWSTFFVRAATANPGIFFDSPVDSSYSIDNLAPEPTIITAALEIVGSDIVLRWEEVTTGGGGQPELNGIWYRVYGDTDPEFSPESENLLTTTQALSYSHPISEEQFYFKVLVSDDH